MSFSASWQLSLVLIGAAPIIVIIFGFVGFFTEIITKRTAKESENATSIAVYLLYNYRMK
jgi:ABC-type bacteriocin/lantibiotic exporter with double-glycine peptidase domain